MKEIAVGLANLLEIHFEILYDIIYILIYPEIAQIIYHIVTSRQHNHSSKIKRYLYIRILNFD